MAGFFCFSLMEVGGKHITQGGDDGNSVPRSNYTSSVNDPRYFLKS